MGPTRRLPIPVVPWWVRWAMVAAVAGVIFYYSIWTVPPTEPASPGGITLPSPTPEDDRTPDLLDLIEWRHVLAYFGLGLTLAYALVTEARPLVHKAAVVVAAAFLYGLAIEVGQGLFTYRTFATDDLWLNAAGALASTVWYAYERHGEPVDLAVVARRLAGRDAG